MLLHVNAIRAAVLKYREFEACIEPPFVPQPMFKKQMEAQDVKIIILQVSAITLVCQTVIVLLSVAIDALIQLGDCFSHVCF